MKTKHLKSFVFFLLICFYQFSQAQDLTVKDYQRAKSYLWNNLSKNFKNLSITPIWLEDQSGVSYFFQNKEGKEWMFSSFKDLKTSTYVSMQKLSTLLNTPISELDLKNIKAENANLVHFTFKDIDYDYEITTNTLKKVSAPTEEKLKDNEVMSPDKKWIAFTKDYNVYIKSTKDGSIKQITDKGERYYEYGTWYGWSDIIEGENGKRPENTEIYWSPDSKWIQSYLVDLRVAEKMYLLDYSIDTIYKPKLLSYYRASPGDTNIVKVTPIFINVEKGTLIEKTDMVSTHTNPPSYNWLKESGHVIQQKLYRGYQYLTIHHVDLNTNSQKLLYEEKSATNIDNFWYNVNEKNDFVYMLSEREGWRQLYSLEIKNAKLKRITSGDFYINTLLSTEIKNKGLLFMASGKEANENPYAQYLYHCNLENGKTTLLTKDKGHHDISLSKNQDWIIDTYSSLDKAPITKLISTQNLNKSLEIATADISYLKESLSNVFPEAIQAVARDGKTTIYGAIWKPSNFDASKKYPIIDHSYTGPHTFMYPRTFNTAFSRSNQALAELGFIVIMIDGMGTANRSKAFHNVSYKNMGKNLEDHKLAITQLANKYNFIDINRIGIFGHSAGGFDTGHALLEYSDFYKVGVASSADHDFRMEKAWWPEMYMGWPVDNSYHEVSNITMAKNLKGKLLLVHGGIDENVNPSATFKLAENFIKHDKNFDLLIIPSQRHGYTGIYSAYFTKKRWNYFVEHLLGQKPLWDYSLN